jgi:hypothetical protein
MGEKSDFEYRRVGKILQRSDHCRIRRGHLERKAVSGGVRTIKQKFEIGNPKKIHMLKKKTPKFATEPRSKK